MKAGNRINYDDDLVVVIDNKNNVVYRGLEDYEPFKREYWRFVETTKSGKGHYEWNGLRKFNVG